MKSLRSLFSKKKTPFFYFFQRQPQGQVKIYGVPRPGPSTGAMTFFLKNKGAKRFFFLKNKGEQTFFEKNKGAKRFLSKKIRGNRVFSKKIRGEQTFFEQNKGNRLFSDFLLRY